MAAQQAATHSSAVVMDGEVRLVILKAQVWPLNVCELHGGGAGAGTGTGTGASTVMLMLVLARR